MVQTFESYSKTVDTKAFWSQQPIKEVYNTLQHFLKWLVKKDPWSKEYTDEDWHNLNQRFSYMYYHDLSDTELKDVIMNINYPYERCRFYTFKEENGYRIEFQIFVTSNRGLRIAVYTDKIYRSNA